jgi:hypothetical protein
MKFVIAAKMKAITAPSLPARNQPTSTNITVRIVIKKNVLNLFAIFNYSSLIEVYS